jgi:8-oxo-dGTP pyrophosphatase MutT (NUDIX family)
MSEALVQFAQKAVIVFDGVVLLVQKGAGDPYNPGCWELPGGRLKQGEILDMALYREVKEEVGLYVTPGRPLALWEFRLGSVTVVAVARLCEPKDIYVDLGGNAVGDHLGSFGWFEPEDIMGLDLISDSRDAMAQIVEILQKEESEDD